MQISECCVILSQSLSCPLGFPLCNLIAESLFNSNILFWDVKCLS